MKDLADRVQRGETLNRYSHGERPLREERIQTVAGGGSRGSGVITRNAYGAVVLNATQAMFVDNELFNPPDDALIIDGFPVIDPEAKSIAVFATDVTTKLLQAAERQAQSG